MTRLFARIHAPEEAALAAAAGFEGSLAEGSTSEAGALRRFQPARPGDPPQSLAVFSDALPDAGALDRARDGGAAGILLDPSGRLLAGASVADLAALRAACAARALLCGFGGKIEPPDMPRLLALGPDLLVAGEILRGPGGALDPAALAFVRDLVPQEGAPADPAIPPAQRPDRIFLRDFVLPIAIGAYDSERGRLQRVRFAVEADLSRADRPARDMRDVVSYDLFTDAIQALTADRHVDLAETLAEAIAARVLAHPRVLAVRVTVEKLEVGLGTVGVSIERARP